MKWISHKIVTFSIVFLITNNPFSAFVSSIGSIFPDAVEGKYNPKRHRKLSHWLLGYLILLLICWLYIFLAFHINPLSLNLKEIINIFKHFDMGYYDVYLLFITSYISFFFLLGALLHVVEDSFSSTVPVFHPQKRTFSIKIIPFGGKFEFFVTVISVLVIAYKGLTFIKSLL